MVYYVCDIVLFVENRNTMGDSDEEYDNRRSGREKFQRERPSTDGGRERGRSMREPWGDNNDRGGDRGGDRGVDRVRTRSDK
mgnify:FL=1